MRKRKVWPWGIKNGGKMIISFSKLYGVIWAYILDGLYGLYNKYLSGLTTITSMLLKRRELFGTRYHKKEPQSK